MESKPVNPLAKNFRQPKMYIKLPSGGKYYPEGALDMPFNGEIPIYPLTTKDEIVLRTPDALLNGNSVTSVITSCCPSIKDPWAMPSIDVDAILIAIRIASYGVKMPVTVACPACNDTAEYDIDLRVGLDQITSPDYNDLITTDDGLKIKLKPQDYTSVNKVHSMRFEHENIVNQFSDTSVPIEEREARLAAQLMRIATINIEIITDATEYIQTEDNQIVSDKAFIEEFYRNSDAKVNKLVEAKFGALNADAGAKPIPITCGECGHGFKANIEFDYSNFFGAGS